VKENSINKKEVDNGIKINIPIISNQEIENTINTENLYDKIAKQIYHDREMIILQEFIKKLQKENEELENDNKYLRERESYLEKRRKDIINIFQNQQTNTTIPIQNVKDKIEEILNNGEYIIIFEGDAEFPDEATCIDAQKYIKLEKLQELLEGRKI
jgi:hypothetical protein